MVPRPVLHRVTATWTVRYLSMCKVRVEVLFVVGSAPQLNLMTQTGKCHHRLQNLVKIKIFVVFETKRTYYSVPVLMKNLQNDAERTTTLKDESEIFYMLGIFYQTM